MGDAAMTTTDFSHLVRMWFDIAGQANGPLLPDGWFGGRPRENIYFLEHVDSHENSLAIYLSEDTILRFDGTGRVFVENSDLVFDGFRQATLRWKHYGGGEDSLYHERTYEEGQVRLAAPIGTKIEIS
jgi:hypothetical protein